MKDNDKKQARIAEIKAKLAEMAQPGYYGSWCSGYLRNALKAELKKLEGK
jgi:hypothetical protein